MSDLDRWMTKNEVAKYLSVSVRTLDRWCAVGKGPRRYDNGEIVRYRKSDIDKWIADTTCSG
jgi:excisionase family DNA binding protein